MSQTSAATAARSVRIQASSAVLLDLASLGLVAFGNALMAARLNLAPLAVILIAAAFFLRLAQYRLKLLALPLQLPWLLFLVSAWIGVTVSYDPTLSLGKFYLILGGIALYYVLATTQTMLAKQVVSWGVMLLGVGVGLYFLTQTDFTQEPIKLGSLNQLGLLIHRFSPQFGLHTPHPNLIAGIILLALPYALGLAYDSLRHKRLPVLVLSGAVALFLTFSLVMTTSRGALLALVLLGIVCAYLYAAVRVSRRIGVSSGLGVVTALNVLLVVLLLGLMLGGARIGSALAGLAGTVSGVPRPLLYQQVSQLAQDYVFTGAGLDTFSPNFSTYELLINVPFLVHGHNLYLQIWYEQGILGIVAFVWLLLAYYIWALRRRSRMNGLAIASIAATSLMLIHGWVDVLFYFSRVISLMFIPLGLTVCALEPFVPPATDNHTASQQVNPRRSRIAGAIAGAILVLLLVLFIVVRREQLTALWIANWGALRQAQLELPQINFPTPTPGQVRRSTDLSGAEALYRQALEHDSQNRVANSRLGLIALDRYEFDHAVSYLEAAFRADKNNRAAIKSLGLAYLWMGKPDRAQPLLAQIPEASSDLGYAAQNWIKLDRKDLAARAQEMIKRLKQ